MTDEQAKMLEGLPGWKEFVEGGDKWKKFCAQAAQDEQLKRQLLALPTGSPRPKGKLGAALRRFTTKGK